MKISSKELVKELLGILPESGNMRAGYWWREQPKSLASGMSERTRGDCKNHLKLSVLH